MITHVISSERQALIVISHPGHPVAVTMVRMLTMAMHERRWVSGLLLVRRRWRRMRRQMLRVMHLLHVSWVRRRVLMMVLGVLVMNRILMRMVLMLMRVHGRWLLVKHVWWWWWRWLLLL
jgi:hypothetical protein